MQHEGGNVGVMQHVARDAAEHPFEETVPAIGAHDQAVGAERVGLPEDVVAQADVIAHIPIRTDSLNAAMAATVALYETTARRD